MAVLEHLEPGRVFHFFEQMSAIPRGSGNTKAVSDWLAEFARERGLRYQQDALNNIIIFKDASAGYEGAEPVILQGHMDMVCEKAPDCGKDMTREGLDLAIDGDFVYAKGTTLGGDDGIAVAMALAVLDDESLPHPPIEAVITVDEETGMDGAMGIDVSGLKGRRMLNIDSEDEGVFTVSHDGVLSGVAPGTATLTATAASGVSATCNSFSTACMFHVLFAPPEYPPAAAPPPLYPPPEPPE